MKKRQICALLLSAVMVASSLSGCGGKDDSSSSTSNNTQQAETGAQTSGNESDAATDENQEVIELTFFSADATQDDPWTDPVALAITEKTGVKLKTSYPIGGNDESEAVALMIAEQKYPDIVFAKGSANNLIEAGAMMDMSDLIDEYGPNIKKLYGDEYDKLRESADDPAIYQLSAYVVGGEKFKDCGPAQIQWDALKAKDYALPQTLDELEVMIKDYLAASPKTDSFDA